AAAAPRRPPPPARPRLARLDRSRLHLDLERLDQRVREQLLAHARHLVVRVPLVARLELEVDDAPDAGLADGEAEVPERAPHRLALGVEDARLRANGDDGPHRSTSSGSVR